MRRPWVACCSRISRRKCSTATSPAPICGKLTEHTETNPAALRRILKTVREKRLAAVEDELDYGLVSVALPICGPAGQVVAAANCSDVTNRFDKDAIIEQRLPTLRRAVRRIENMLAQFPELAASVTFDVSNRMPLAR